MAEASSTVRTLEMEGFASRKQQRQILERTGWVVLALLLCVGLSSVIARMLFMVDALTGC